MPELKQQIRKRKNAEKATNATLSLTRAPKKPREVRMSAARRRFLFFYEKSFGNVSASCEFAGIHRSTFYRWLNSNSRVNRKFRRQFEAVKPKERQKDFIEAKFMQLVAEGVPSVVIHGAKTICGDRGFNDRVSDQKRSDPLTEDARRVKTSIEYQARQKGISYNDELESFLKNHSHLFKREIIDRLLKEQTGRR